MMEEYVQTTTGESLKMIFVNCGYLPGLDKTLISKKWLREHDIYQMSDASHEWLYDMKPEEQSRISDGIRKLFPCN